MSVSDHDPHKSAHQSANKSAGEGVAAPASPGAPPVGILAWIEGESERLEVLIPKLESAALELTDELADADVIRRHVILHPERFSPHERDVAVEKAHELGERRQRAEVMAQAVREQLQLCQAMAAGVRALVQAEVDSSSPGSRSALGRPPASQTLAIFQAVEVERLRIARKLHDGPARILADLVLKAEILDRIAKRAPEALPAELDDFKSQVRTAVADMRRFMFDLRPDSLDELGLIPTMKRFAAEFQEQTGITCTLIIGGEELPVGAALSDGLFRIVQEALANIRKHARAASVEVALTVEPDRVLLTVVDDGAGFPAEMSEPAGRETLGIIGMRERALALDGSLEVTSLPGQGTRIQGEFPTSRRGVTRPGSK